MKKPSEVNQINEMIQVLRNLAKGDYSEQIMLPGINNDLDSLAMEINMMIDDMGSSNGVEKTRIGELEKTNEELQITQDASEIVLKDLDVKSRELNALNNELQKKTHDLGERVKELNCLYGASILMSDKKLSIEQVLLGIVELIPPSWQYPQITCARIVYKEKEFTTSNYKETNWKQNAPIFIGNEEKGAMEVGYLEEKPEINEGPFLLEERDLINSLAREIGRFLERQKTQMDIQLYMEQLKEKNKELDNFTYIVSHDLKAPLITIQGFADLLKRKYDDQLDERAVHYLDNMVNAANDLNFLITDLLEFSRVGRKEFKKEKVSLLEAVNRSLFSLQGMVNETHAKIAVAPDLPEIMYDPVRLGQVLNNLISNAIKYSSSKSPPKIELGWSKEKKEIRFWVKDNGIGISSDNINKVFKPFTRVSGDKRGTGIGLSIVKTIIERHGGKIWVDSQMNKGSTFYLTIPKES